MNCPLAEGYKTEEISTKNNHRYLGKELDKETGLIYMGARYLDPKTGRFNRPDPVQLVDPATGKINQQMLLNPQRQNRYVYGLNNPYRYADADGNFAILGTLFFAALLLALNPDVANTPKKSSSPTYESHGARGMVADTASVVALGAAGKGVSKFLRRDFFKGTRYSSKVIRQMQKGDFHSFPESVKAFQHEGKITKIVGNDRVIRKKLTINGGYKGHDGQFEFIKESNGEIKHRFFKKIK